MKLIATQISNLDESQDFPWHVHMEFQDKEGAHFTFTCDWRELGHAVAWVKSMEETIGRSDVYIVAEQLE